MSTVLIGWIFIQLEANLSGVQTRVFSAFLLVFAQFLFSLLGVVNTFPSERAIFLREAQDRWYHPCAFYIAKVVLDTMMQCFFPIIATGVGYFMIGLNTESAARIFTFYGIMALTSNIGASMGFIISASVTSVSTALAIAPGFMMPQMLLCGIFMPAETLPQPFRAISFVVAARYALQGIITNEFTCETSAECVASLNFWRKSGGALCDQSPCTFCCTDAEMAAAGGVCPVITCDEALKMLKLDADNIWPSGGTPEDTIKYNVLFLLGLLLFFRFQGMNALLVSYRKAARSG
jgi:ABC-type multidrug transport system permease subunit